MSYAVLYKVPANGSISTFKEFRNAWGGAYQIWTQMSKRYLGLNSVPFSFSPSGEDELKKLCALGTDAKVDRTDRIVMALTYDRVLIAKKDMLETARCLDEFNAKHKIEGINHIPAFAEGLRALHEESDAIAAAWLHTSVSGGLWYIRDNPEDEENDEGHMFDFSKDHESFKTWFLFDAPEIVGEENKIVQTSN